MVAVCSFDKVLMNQALFQRPFDVTIKETTLFLLKPHGPQQFRSMNNSPKLNWSEKSFPPLPSENTQQILEVWTVIIQKSTSIFDGLVLI